MGEEKKGKRKIGVKKERRRKTETWGTQFKPPVWEGSRTLGLFQVHVPMNFVSVT